MLYRLFTTADQDSWRSWLPGKTNVFGSVEYAEVMQRQTGHRAHLFVWEFNDFAVVYPFFLRRLDDLPFWDSSPSAMADIQSPEYTGPIALGELSLEAWVAFRRDFDTFCRESGIIAEFARLHPWHSSPGLLEAADVRLDRQIVYVDLTQSEDQLWQQSFTYACRKNIKRARDENVRVFQATTPGDIREFYRIYVHTMDRTQALDKYYFPLDYFMAFFERMSNHATFFLAEYNDQIVAGTLYLHDDTDVYSYLGGADHAFQHVRPTNMVIYELIRWAQRQGKKRFVLGGGYQLNDGIFRFKASFSPLRADFYVYRHVHLPETYANLCQAWVDYYQVTKARLSETNYFPAYRAIPQQDSKGSL